MLLFSCEARECELCGVFFIICGGVMGETVRRALTHILLLLSGNYSWTSFTDLLLY